MAIDTSNCFVVFNQKNRWIFGAFRGNFNIAYRSENCKGRPDFGENFNRPKFTIIKKEVENIIKAAPESKRPIIFSKYVPDDKKYVTDFVICFIKDGEQIFHMQVDFKDQQGNSHSEKCTFMAPSGISTGSEPMSKAERSSIMFEAFYEWLRDEAPVVFAISRERWEPPTGNDNKSSKTEESSYFG